MVANLALIYMAGALFACHVNVVMELKFYASSEADVGGTLVVTVRVNISPCRHYGGCSRGVWQVWCSDECGNTSSHWWD